MANAFLDSVVGSYKGYAQYLWNEITFGYDWKPWWENYFWWLVLLSLVFFGLELLRPWRKNQPRFRKDFWLDVFYMFFNFFLFSLIIFNAASNIAVDGFNNLLHVFGLKNIVAIQLQTWPAWAQLLLMFVLADFINWNTHRLLHAVPRLWEFHKLHHSVEQMGFAAHLRYHWMETIVYNLIKYLPLAMIGFSITDFFPIHILALAIGHYNHANITVSGRVSGGIAGILAGLFVSVVALGMTDVVPLLTACALGAAGGYFLLGPYMKIIFNSPEMHIWHHAMELPQNRRKGVNFGISLALWDYIFGTAWMPSNGRDIPLGFPGLNKYPHDFVHQEISGFSPLKDS